MAAPERLGDDVLGDRERGGGAGRGCVAHVHDPVGAGDHEVDDRPRASMAWARIPRGPRVTSAVSMPGTYLRASATKIGRAERGPRLPYGGRDVAGREPPEAGEAHGVAHVARHDLPWPVRLASQRRERVRAEHHRSVDALGQVHAEERVARVGHGVDQPLTRCRLAGEQEVVAVERHDPQVAGLPGPTGEPVGLQPGAGDDQVELVGATGGADPDRAAALLQGGDLVAEAEGAAGVADSPASAVVIAG